MDGYMSTELRCEILVQGLTRKGILLFMNIFWMMLWKITKGVGAEIMDVYTDEKYVEGYDLSNLEHIVVISSYNHNYYNDEGQLLFARSDDDNTSEWYLIKGIFVRYIGCTFESEQDNHLHKFYPC